MDEEKKRHKKFLHQPVWFLHGMRVVFGRVCKCTALYAVVQLSPEQLIDEFTLSSQLALPYKSLHLATENGDNKKKRKQQDSKTSAASAGPPRIPLAGDYVIIYPQNIRHLVMYVEKQGHQMTLLPCVYYENRMQKLDTWIWKSYRRLRRNYDTRGGQWIRSTETLGNATESLEWETPSDVFSTTFVTAPSTAPSIAPSIAPSSPTPCLRTPASPLNLPTSISIC